MLARTLRQPLLARSLARSYASAAAKTGTAPPVQLFGLEGSYASALYSASAKDSSIDATEKSLGSLKSLLAEDSKLDAILANPALSASDKKFLVDTVSKAAGGDKTITNFLQVLADNNRLTLLKEVISQFEILSNAYHGYVDATVTSVTPLDDKTLQRLKAAISKSSLVGGKELRLSNITKPDILGGLVVEIGDRTVDLSVSSKIARLNKLLSDSI